MPRSLWLTRVGLTLLTTMAVAGGTAGPARAATTGVASVPGEMEVQYLAGSDRVNKVVVTRSGNVITIDDRVTVRAGKGCKRVKGDKTRVRCTTPSAPNRVLIHLGNRNDSVTNQSGLPMLARGGAGNDRLTGGIQTDNLYGGSGTDLLRGGGESDNLYGGTGVDRVYGQGGDDRAYGGPGNDRVYGGSGNDRLEEGSDPSGSDSDRLSGGSGWDVASYRSRTRNITADLSGSAGNDGAKGERDTLLTDLEGITGGSAADRLTGSAGPDQLVGGRGNDLLRGRGGEDWLYGGEGRDRLEAGGGDDHLLGDDNSIRVFPDVLLGGSGSDRAEYYTYTQPVRVDLDGEAGDDGQAGEHDTVGRDVEDITGGSGNDELIGNAAVNRIAGSDGDDTIRGGGGRDLLTGDHGADTLYGEDGDDLLSAGWSPGDGTDRLDGGGQDSPVGDNCYTEEPTVDVTVNCEYSEPW